MTYIGEGTKEVLLLKDINWEPAGLCRHSLDTRLVQEFRDAMEMGADFPGPIVFRDGTGKIWGADGRKRAAATERRGYNDITCEVREGTRKEALLFAASGKAQDMGERRSKEDCFATFQALTAEPEWADRSGRWLSEVTGISQPMIAEFKARVGMDGGIVEGKDRRKQAGRKKTTTRKAQGERQPGEDDAQAKGTKNGALNFDLRLFNKAVGKLSDELDKLAVQFGLCTPRGRVRETPPHQAIVRLLEQVKAQVKDWQAALKAQAKESPRDEPAEVPA